MVTNDDRFSWGKKAMNTSDLWHSTVQQYSFARIPNALFEYSGVLELSPEELGFVCMLLSHMRYKNVKTGQHSKIYPSLSKMAKLRFSKASRDRLGRIKDALIEKCLLKTISKKEGNLEFDLTGLFALLYLLTEEDRKVKQQYYTTKSDDTPPAMRELADKDRIQKLKLAKDKFKEELGLK